MGRFTQSDLWEGDRWQPVTLQPYLYTGNNPTNRTDPSGLYGKDDVHYQLTLEIAQSALGHLGVYGTRTAWLIARGNWAMDAEGDLNWRQRLHFVDWSTASANAERAIRTGHPYIFGATLHQVQDYFSHRYEGFCIGSGEGCMTADGHWRYSSGKRLETTIRGFYHTHRQSDIQRRLATLYPGIDFSEAPTNHEDHLPPFTKNELIDLYLREWRTGLSRWEEREQYGYWTDVYFPHTYRDQEMVRETKRFITLFVREITKDSCLFAQALAAQEDTGATVRFFKGE